MELDELHVDELGAGLVGERLAVAGVLPGVRRDLVRLAEAAGGEHERLRAEDDEAPGLAPVADRAGDAVAVLERPHDRALHVDVDALVDAAVLQGADELEPRPVADVGESLVGVPAERALQDPAVGGPVEDGAPALELAHPLGRFLRVQLGHAPVVEELAALHRVLEVRLPAVLGVDVAERRRDAALGHDRVRLAEERLAHERRLRARGRRLDGGPQAGAAGADDDDVELMSLVFFQASNKPPVLDVPGGDHPDVEVGDSETPKRLAHATACGCR